jgi:multiple sugar transport system ATP-binding protein
MAEVRFENVTKKYGAKVAIRNLNLTLKDGEFFSFIGPAGAGKSTCLKMVAGIEPVTEGNIYIGGKRVNDLPPQERNVAMAFETYNLYPNFSVYDNIAFPLRSPKIKSSMTPEKEKAAVEEIANFLGIGSLLDRRPVQLSGGQKQRVSLARAMVRKPLVYLLDEPIAHLDARLKFTTQTQLKKLASQLGINIIYVTHDYREALSLSNRLAVLRKGVIEQMGTPEDVFYRPTGDFVGRFVGEPPINLVDGEIITKDGKTFFKSGEDFTLTIQESCLGQLQQAIFEEKGKKMSRLGIRCQEIKIAKNKISDSSIQLPIYAIAREAEATLFTFELKRVFLQVKVDNVAEKYSMSEKVWLDFNQNHMFFFKKTIEIGK